MTRFLLLVFTLVVLFIPASSAAAPAPDAAKQMAELEGRVGQLEKAAKDAEVPGLLSRLNTHLEAIRGKIPDPERWTTWSARLDGIATASRTTSNAALLGLVVVVAVVVGSLVMNHLQRAQMNRVAEEFVRTVRAMTERDPAAIRGPIIAAVEPPLGPTSGATPVRLRGRQFQPSAAVRFGSSLAGAVTFVSSELIEASTPVGLSGPCDISVQNPDGGLDRLGDGYRYVPPPEIRGVVPADPPVIGITLTVFGRDFQPNATVLINGAPVPTAFGSDNHVTCQLPAGQAGQAVTVALRNPDQQLNQWVGQITYH